MGKKTKSKQRLDQYYRYAKTQGYRSRAAYKLIQLNRKYNFLNNATAVIDLCAAPGGWMQVCANTMPNNSTIIGVDLDEIKKVQGAMSFKGDITKQETFDRLKKELKGRKCDAVLNDGAPNVGANWNKDAYSQSQLVLAAFKLSCDFLKEGGHFVTKVFRSTDTNSLMWVFKKFFEKVEMTKPKASRFVSAETFVVGVGYSAPDYIDERYFDPKWVFKDTEADHFHDQMIGDITNIDKVLQNRRKRGGYEDNAPMHLYKEISLTEFINSPHPLVCFVEYNKMTVSEEERSKYYQIAKKMPEDFDELLNDLKVLGKRQISQLMKWRGKIRHFFHQEKQKTIKMERQMTEQQEIVEDESPENSQDQLQKQLLAKRKKQLKKLRDKQEKRSQTLIKAKAANIHFNEDQELGNEQLEELLDADLDKLGYQEPEAEEKVNNKLPKYIKYTPKQMEENIEEMYELRQQRKKQKQDHAREVKERKKQRRQQRRENMEHKLKSRRIYSDEQQMEDENQNEKNTTQKEFESFQFRNPLADFQDDEIYLSDQEVEQYQGEIDPDERMEGEVSDDDAYVIPKPLSDMEKRRKRIKKQQKKKDKKLRRDIEEGEDTGGQIEIVKEKNMDDYDINSLAETLAIAKKMLRNRPRESIIESSYRGFTFQDHDDLPKWFTDDEKRHNFKQPPITKEQFEQQKKRLEAINARVPKKILEAKVRRKIRIQKKLKRTQKKAEAVMNQDGIDEVNKLRQVAKLYDKSKRELKDQKKYVITRKNKAGPGKDARGVKHVDARMKKDKKAQSKRIKKTRHVSRKHKRRGKF